MIYKTVIYGYEISCNITTRGAVFRSDLFAEPFKSEEELLKAVKSYDLENRKDFTNKTAYVRGFRGSDPVDKIEITSICPNGKEAWIKKHGERTKVFLSDVFTSQAEVSAAIAYESCRRAEIAANWQAVTRWAPQAR